MCVQYTRNDLNVDPSKLMIKVLHDHMAYATPKQSKTCPPLYKSLDETLQVSSTLHGATTLVSTYKYILLDTVTVLLCFNPSLLVR